LREHKPFECVGEIAESAAVMAHLGDHPDWREDAVVRRLHDLSPSLRKAATADYRALFGVRHPNRVPQAFMAMLDACG
jgi:UDP-N-acetyl-alpha-D-muramoyl-L-alanyl-L-glutamate epimerase